MDWLSNQIISPGHCQIIVKKAVDFYLVQYLEEPGLEKNLRQNHPENKLWNTQQERLDNEMLINRNLYKGANQDETRHMNEGLKR